MITTCIPKNYSYKTEQVMSNSLVKLQNVLHYKLEWFDKCSLYHFDHGDSCTGFIKGNWNTECGTACGHSYDELFQYWYMSAGNSIWNIMIFFVSIASWLGRSCDKICPSLSLYQHCWCKLSNVTWLVVSSTGVVTGVSVIIVLNSGHGC